MSNSCRINACVRDPLTGKLTSKTSMLHKGLLGLGKFCPSFTRQKANDVLCMALTDKFLELFKDDLIFDANGEPGLVSVWETTNSSEMSDVTVSLMRDFLAKKFSTGSYTYEEAYARATEFNLKANGSKTFIGIVKYDEVSKSFQFDIEYNSVENQEAYINLVKQITLNNILIQKLESLGIGIDLMQGQEVRTSKGVYNTINPQRLQNGLLGIIALKNPKFDFKTLSNEVGHFIVGSMHNHALVKRLLTLVGKNPEAIKAVLGDLEWNNIVTGESTLSDETIQYEIIGHLVSKFLQEPAIFKQETKLQLFKSLINRLWEAARDLFSKVTYLFFDSAERLAEYSARLLAKKFLGNNFEGTKEDALELKQRLHTDETGAKNTIGLVAQLLELLEKILESSGSYDEAKALKLEVSNLQSTYLSMHEMSMSNAEIAEALNKSFTVLLKLTKQIVDDISFFEGLEVTKKDWQACASLIRKYDKLKSIINDIATEDKISLLKDLLNSELSTPSEDKEDVIRQLRNLDAITKTLHLNIVFDTAINSLTKKMVRSFCIETTGSDAFYIPNYRGAALYYNNTTSDPLYKGNNARLQERVLDIMDYINLTNLQNLGIFSRWIYSMGSSPDIINLIAHMSVAIAKHRADENSRSLLENIKTLYEEWQDGTSFNRSTNNLCEHDNGLLTGYFMSHYNYGRWEAAKKNFRENAIKSFMDKNVKSKENPTGKYLSKLYAFKSKEYKDYIKALMKLFHEEHSILEDIIDSKGNVIMDPFSGKPKLHWIPYDSTIDDSREDNLHKVDYHNDDWDSLGENLLNILSKLVALKKELDELIPPKSRNSNLIPLFRKNYMGAVMSQMASGNAKMAGKILLKRSYLAKIASISSLADFDYNWQFNLEVDEDTLAEENLFGWTLKEDLRTINNVPVFGTKKLKDIGNMCTDPFSALVAYGNMAYSFDAMHEVALCLEIAKFNASENRKINSHNKGLKEYDNKKYFELLDNFLNLNVYKTKDFLNSKYENKQILKAKILATQWAKGWSRMTSIFLLGGNVASAYINLGTAFNAICKEAIAGEHFTRSDLAWAFASYAKFMAHSGIGFITALLGDKDPLNTYESVGGVMENITRVSLFAKKFNIGEKNNYKDFNFARFGHSFFSHLSYTDIVMAPYSITDDFMLSMAYLATLRHIKVKLVNLDTNETKMVSLWDAYSSKGNVLHLKPGYDYYFYDKNLSNINRIKKEKATGEPVDTNETDVWLPMNELAVLDSSNENIFDIEDPDDITTLTNENTQKAVLTEVEGRVIEVIRAINNRMHGVYNEDDSGKFCNTWYGPMALTLKKYSIGLIEERFKSTRYSLMNNDIIEGSYISLLKIILAITTQNQKFDNVALNGVYNIYTGLKVILGGAMPFGLFNESLVRKPLKLLGFSNNQIANYNRCWADLSCMIAMQLLNNMFKPDLPPDPDDDELNDFTDSELKNYAKRLGIKVKSRVGDYTDDEWDELRLQVYEIRNARMDKDSNEDSDGLFSYINNVTDTIKWGSINPSKIQKSRETSLEEYPIINNIVNILTFGTCGWIDTNDNTAIKALNDALVAIGAIDLDKVNDYVIDGDLKWYNTYSEDAEGNPIYDNLWKALKMNVTETPYSLKGIGYYLTYALWSELASLADPLNLVAMPLLDLGFSNEYDDSSLRQAFLHTVGEYLGLSEIIPNLAMITAASLLMTYLGRLPEADENGNIDMNLDMENPNSYFEKQGNYKGVARWRHFAAKYTPYLRSALAFLYAYKSAQGRQYGKLRTVTITTH